MTPAPSVKPPQPSPSGQNGWRQRLHTIIFEADTPAGKLFDVVLLILILISVLVVMLETVDDFAKSRYASLLPVLEIILTGLFTLEYVLRLICVRRPLRYAFSFYGIIDLISILPFYVGLVFAGSSKNFAIIRAVRLLRVFRIFKLTHFLSEGEALRNAIWASRAKITVFLSTVLILVTVVGSLLYMVEDPYESGFTSIPQSVYWAIVTLTTVGYGDIAPVTGLGKAFASLLMIAGYSLIIVPTGIISSEMVSGGKAVKATTQVCPDCQREGHDGDALHCKFCGGAL